MLLSTRGLWKVQRTTGLPAHINLPKCTHQQRCSRRWKVRAAGQAGGEAPSLKDPEDGCSGLFPLPQDFLRDLGKSQYQLRARVLGHAVPTMDSVRCCCFPC